MKRLNKIIDIELNDVIKNCENKINKNGLNGNIDVQEDGVLFMSCLYNDELDVYVDGVKQDKIKLLDTFIGVNLEKGKHEIMLKYTPKTLYLSFIPSLIGLCSLIVIYIKKKKQNS